MSCVGAMGAAVKVAGCSASGRVLSGGGAVLGVWGTKGSRAARCIAAYIAWRDEPDILPMLTGVQMLALPHHAGRVPNVGSTEDRSTAPRVRGST